MNDEELAFPFWQAPLQDLILEFDRERLAGKIRHVEGLIAERLQQLLDVPEGFSERQALDQARSIVSLVKRDRLANE